MFIRTILSIRACTESTKSSIRKTSLNHVTGKDDVMLYVRMSTVMGFTWVFGLASSFVSSFARASETVCIVLHTLGILFIVFNCSQGIFIFFAFVFNRRILGLYKAKFSRARENNERGISVSSSRTTLSTRVSNTSLSHIRWIHMELIWAKHVPELNETLVCMTFVRTLAFCVNKFAC